MDRQNFNTNTGQTKPREITVGLPVYNSKKIAWLAMESLCNQRTEYSWELIICEEQHEQILGLDFYLSYKDRLSKAGCVEIVYIKLAAWVNLIKKWQLIGQQAKGETFIMQAADCYSPSLRLQITHNEIKEGAGWVDFTKGYFYDFSTKKMLFYNSTNRTNLNMGFRTEYLKRLKHSPQKSGVDGYLHINFMLMNKKLTVVRIDNILYDSLDTNGYNNISQRKSFFEKPIAPFEKTNKGINDLNLPNYIKEKICQLDA